MTTIRLGEDTNQPPQPSPRYWCGRCGHPIATATEPGWSWCPCWMSGVHMGEDWRDPAANHAFTGDVRTLEDLE